MASRTGTGLWLAAAVLCAIAAGMGRAAEPPDADPDAVGAAHVPAMAMDDWYQQEHGRGRTPQHTEAITDAMRRVTALCDDMLPPEESSPPTPQRAALKTLQAEVRRLPSSDPDRDSRTDLYLRVRRLGRELALSHPSVAGRPIVFLKQRRFICQMLHEYVGYYYDYCGISGGGVCVLERPGRSLQVRELTAGRLPRGSYTTPALSYDGRTVYFAFCEVRDLPRPHGRRENWHGLPAAAEVPAEFNYFGPERRAFHIYAIGSDGTGLRQLTAGPDDDFDPCPLPDGGLAFLSARRGGFCRCNNDFEPLPTYTLHRMDADGRNVRTLSYHETNEWHPAVLNDGRIAYCRWDYVDRSAAHYHGLWACNPDGSNPHLLMGNYTQQISACYLPRPVPDSHQIAFIAGAHHAAVGGSLAMFDPRRARLDPQTGEDRLESLARLTPQVCFPETPNQWPKSYFNTPWPLSESRFLVAFSHEPLPGFSSGYTRDAKTGLYYLDRFGNLELLYRDAELSCTGPMLLAARPTPPVIPSTFDPALGEEGEFVLANVAWSLLPLPPDRPIRKLRVYQVLPKSGSHVANRPRLGYANAESARILLGEAPVEADGSAYFRAPAGKLLYFQAVDAAGRAVQTMRSATYLQPGERRGCVGCHEPGSSAVAGGNGLLATRRPASVIEPGPDGTQPMSFPRLVQPVLDAHCVRCHRAEADPPGNRLRLTGEPAGAFSRAYQGLEPFTRWYEWGGKSISQIVTRPGHGGADESRLLPILDDATHAPALKLSADERRRLVLWLDGNAPFYGVYDPTEQAAQRDGKAVPPPQLQ